MGTSLKGKNLLTEGANSFLKEHFLMVYHIKFPPLNGTIFIMLVGICVMVDTSMACEHIHVVYKCMKAQAKN